MKHRAALLTLSVVCVVLFCGADWLQFRGTDNNPVSPGPRPPLEWDAEKNVAWKAELPGRSASSPIVVEGRVLVTSATGFKQNRLHVVCFDAEGGEKLWHRQFWATGRTICHATSSVAAPTPASDGERVYAFFSSNDLVCLDLDGNLQWLRGITFDYPTAANDIGMAASPLVIGDTVIVQVENEGNSFAAGLDAATGVERWKVKRTAQMNWASPTVYRGGPTGNDLVLLQSRDLLSAHEPHTGKLVWSYDEALVTIASPVAVGEAVYAPGEDGVARLEHAGGKAPRAVWQQNKLSASSPSPLVYRGGVYSLNRGGVLTCAEAADGEVAWQTRLRGRFWATPVAADGHLYCINDQGLGFVVEPAAGGRIVARNELGDEVLGTPAVVDGALYVQGAKWLWKIAEPAD